jgi:hypothetical protein
MHRHCAGEPGKRAHFAAMRATRLGGENLQNWNICVQLVCRGARAPAGNIRQRTGGTVTTECAYSVRWPLCCASLIADKTSLAAGGSVFGSRPRSDASWWAAHREIHDRRLPRDGRPLDHSAVRSGTLYSPRAMRTTRPCFSKPSR